WPRPAGSSPTGPATPVPSSSTACASPRRSPYRTTTRAPRSRSAVRSRRSSTASGSRSSSTRASVTARCSPRHVPSSSSPEPPAELVALAEQRASARAERDFAAADRLRDEIAAAGWLVGDGADGFTLTPKPPYDVLPAPAALPDNSDAPDTRRATVSVLVDGWPDDVRACLDALL